LLEWFNKNVAVGETWLDIGAHYGYTAIALCELVGGGGRVFAFEPMVATAGCLSRTRALNRLQQLTVIAMALDDHDDLTTKSLPQVRGMIDSGLVRGDFEEVFLAGGLDWAWRRLAPMSGAEGAPIHGVKIDVQGMEIEVLRGMRQTLSRWKPKLAVELHQGVSRQQLLDVLANVGYPQPGYPIEPLPGETAPLYADDRSYAFFPVT
jgi:FkbM family methyltransferase